MTEPELSQVLFLCSGNYYRSRFAELLFNHWAERTGLAYRADSAGLCIDCHTRNPGPISIHTREALALRGIALPEPVRAPRDVRAQDIARAALTIALKEAEHRPLLRERFPEWCDRVEFWQVDDVADAAPSVALPMIERHVLGLVERLRQREPGSVQIP